VEKNPTNAAQWYRRAAQAGDAAAQNNLGALLRDGLGVPQDFAQAADWFKRAADQGYAKAMLNLGALYEQQAKAAAGRPRAPQAAPASPSAPARSVPVQSAPTAIPLTEPSTPVGKPLQ
jgi:TPR repeat protein